MLLVSAREYSYALNKFIEFLALNSYVDYRYVEVEISHAIAQTIWTSNRGPSLTF